MQRAELVDKISRLALDVAIRILAAEAGESGRSFMMSRIEDSDRAEAAGVATKKAVEFLVNKFMNAALRIPSDADLRAMLQERLERVYLVRGKDQGRSAWHYVIVDSSKHAAFKRQLATGNIDVSRYGRILSSGWGQDPPANVARAIQQEYASFD